MSHEIENFQHDVVERSSEQPVLVDFWAGWCGPCRSLGPVLEKLERQSNGRWRLAKVDVDRNQAVAAEYRVQGIPAVKLFVDGTVVAEFTGALPESQVARWLEANLPSAGRADLEAVVRLAHEGRTDEAAAQLEAMLERDPELEAARVLLAQLVVFSDPVRAEGLLDGLRPGGEQGDIADDVRALCATLQVDPATLPDSPAQADYESGLAALGEQDFERALERLIASIARQKSYHDGGARKACIAIFGYLGREHALSSRFRRALQSVLN